MQKAMRGARAGAFWTGGLKFDPSLSVRTLPELFGLCRILSAQAVDLYRALADRMGDLGNGGARSAFAAIEAEQRRHAEALEVRTPPRLSGAPEPVRRWAELSVFDDEELAGTRLVTPYRALSLAVRNEERAFAFWTYVSAHAGTADVRAEAERLALEQLGRIRRLRAARRRAYHAARPRDGRRASRLRSMSLEEFLAAAAHEETALAVLHARISEKLAQTGDRRAGALARVAEDEAASARSLRGHDAARDHAAGELPDDPERLFGLALERIEAAVEFYLDLAESSPSEDVVAEAQRLSQEAVNRIAALNDLARGRVIGS